MATAIDKSRVTEALGALPQSIPQIIDYQVGPDIGLGEGNYDFAIVADFESVESYQVYQEHPRHLEVIREVIKPAISARVALQYQVETSST